MVLLKYILQILLIVLPVLMISQTTGINTSQPDSRLHIKSNNSLPTLQIEPQVNPDSPSSQGELTVIGDKLYKYDTVRRKWLSIETSIYNFAENGFAETELEYTGDVTRTGAIIPFDGTIVYYAIDAVGGQLNKGVQMIINGNNVPNNNLHPNQDGVVNLTGYRYRNNNYNLDVRKGDVIQFHLAPGPSVVDIKLEIYIKWRRP